MAMSNPNEEKYLYIYINGKWDWVKERVKKNNRRAIFEVKKNIYIIEEGFSKPCKWEIRRNCISEINNQQHNHTKNKLSSYSRKNYWHVKIKA